jgi:hypothetical protein
MQAATSTSAVLEAAAKRVPFTTHIMHNALNGGGFGILKVLFAPRGAEMINVIDFAACTKEQRERAD